MSTSRSLRRPGISHAWPACPTRSRSSPSFFDPYFSSPIRIEPFPTLLHRLEAAREKQHKDQANTKEHVQSESRSAAHGFLLLSLEASKCSRSDQPKQQTDGEGGSRKLDDPFLSTGEIRARIIESL